MENENKDRKLAYSKNKKRKQKKLLLLLLLLLGTGVMLTTSTYAWFTQNETIGVNTITVNIATQGGIQISADGTNWKTILQTTDITGVHATSYTTSVNQLPNALEPVSSALTVTDGGKMEMFYGSVTADSVGDWYLSASPSVELERNGEQSEAKFIAFDMFIKADATSQLYMTPNSKVTTADADDKGIKNASRVAFVVLGNYSISANKTVAEIQALGTTGAASSPVYLWEPNYDSHTQSAVNHARDTYNLTVNAGTGQPAVSYDGVLATIPGETVKVGQANATAHNTMFKAVTPNYRTVFGYSSNVEIFSVQEGITKIRVYMWVEGQDIDCENAASGGNINYDLQFTTNNG